MKGKINYWAIAVFYIIAVSCRFLTTKTPLLEGIHHPFFKTILNGLGPAIGAYVVLNVFDIKTTLTLRGNYKKMMIPFIIYWLLPIVLISSFSFFSGGEFLWANVLVILVYGLLEEIGWRGFLYRSLKPLPLIYNILIVSTMWFLWHLNFDLTISNLLFYGILILGSWGIGKVTDLTNSLLAASAFHSINNFFADLNTKSTAIIAVLLAAWIGGLILRKQLQKNIREQTVL